MQRTLIKLISGCIGLAFGLSVAAETAFAQAQPKTTGRTAAPAAGAAAKPPRTKTYEFDADLLEGTLVSPTGEFASARTFAEHGSLIHVRTDFVKEIVKSAEDL
jgi:hypothetical protein